jgi:hypothetical protein
MNPRATASLIGLRGQLAAAVTSLTVAASFGGMA